MSAPSASEIRSLLIKACPAAVPGLAATSSAPTSLRSNPTRWESKSGGIGGTWVGAGRHAEGPDQAGQRNPPGKWAAAWAMVVGANKTG